MTPLPTGHAKQQEKRAQRKQEHEEDRRNKERWKERDDNKPGVVLLARSSSHFD